MPELPEVETVRQTLRNLVLDKKIEEVLVFHDNIVENEIDYFKNKLVNQTINEIERIGKYLIFILDDYELISHLRMEGKYFLVSHKDEKQKHDHVFFKFKDNTVLKYNDTRKFGKMLLVDKGTYLNSRPIKKLGYEPFDKRLNANDLHNRFLKTSRPIKNTLLDQSYITGLGNIYVDEVLFLCKIHPERKTNSLTIDDVVNIISNSIIVLNKAIELGGTTIHSYESSEGVTGRFQNELLVHTKKDLECVVCENIIIKIKVGGRGTYYCPNCQKI